MFIEGLSGPSFTDVDDPKFLSLHIHNFLLSGQNQDVQLVHLFVISLIIHPDKVRGYRYDG